ncbi:MAG: glycosyltransferase, partial [Bacteroidota bacterium]
MPKALVIIPTFNEAQNAEKVITEVLQQSEIVEVLIVDDNSPDGTADIVKKMMESNPRIHMLQRARKLGLGTAY